MLQYLVRRPTKCPQDFPGGTPVNVIRGCVREPVLLGTSYIKFINGVPYVILRGTDREVYRAFANARKRRARGRWAS